MSKRKPARASKHARNPKMAAKALQAKQAVVRSPKDSRPPSVAADPIEPPPAHHDDAKQEAPIAEKTQEAPIAENRATASQEDHKQTMRDNAPNRGFDFRGFDLPSATANVQAYQAKLLEMTQANMQFAFEFAQRLATIRSPIDTLSFITEFTSKRTSMFVKYSKELTEIGSGR